MTVLTSQHTVVGGGVGNLPRVNLMPPEVAEARALRRIQMMLGAAGVASLAIVGVLYVMAGNSLSSAQSEKATALQRQTQLNNQIQGLSYISTTQSQFDSEKAQLISVMGDEVLYSQVMNDLSLSIPSTVWFKSLNFTTGPTAGATSASAVPTTPVTVNGVPVTQIGQLKVDGIAFSHDDFALWLDAIGKLSKTYTDPYFSSSTEALIGTRKTVNFSATAVVLSTAESGRYARMFGS